MVLAAQPFDDASPGVVLHIAECLLGHRVAEVAGPAAQQRVELAQQVLQGLFVPSRVIVLTLALIEVSDLLAIQV